MPAIVGFIMSGAFTSPEEAEEKGDEFGLTLYQDLMELCGYKDERDVSYEIHVDSRKGQGYNEVDLTIDGSIVTDPDPEKHRKFQKVKHLIPDMARNAAAKCGIK